MTLEQAIAAKPSADMDAAFGSPMPAVTERFVTAFYNSIKSEM